MIIRPVHNSKYFCPAAGRRLVPESYFITLARYAYTVPIRYGKSSIWAAKLISGEIIYPKNINCLKACSSDDLNLIPTSTLIERIPSKKTKAFAFFGLLD